MVMKRSKSLINKETSKSNQNKLPTGNRSSISSSILPQPNEELEATKQSDLLESGPIPENLMRKRMSEKETGPEQTSRKKASMITELMVSKKVDSIRIERGQKEDNREGNSQKNQENDLPESGRSSKSMSLDISFSNEKLKHKPNPQEKVIPKEVYGYEYLQMARDEELIQVYLQGENVALDILFDRYRDTTYRVAYRLLNNTSDALDAVQDGFIKALTHLSGFEGRSSFKTWLMRIVSNAALDLGRKRRRHERFSSGGSIDAGFEPNIRSSTPSSESRLEHQELLELLKNALAELPETQRQTFVLHFDGELSYKEIADTLGISIGTVMSRLFYARQKLKGLIAPRVFA